MSDINADLQSAPATDPYAGKRWGDDITEERQYALDEILAAWDSEVDHNTRKGPFDVVGLLPWSEEYRRLCLSGADVFYLAARALVGGIHPLRGSITDLDSARNILLDKPIRDSVPSSAPVQLIGANLDLAQLAR